MMIPATGTTHHCGTTNVRNSNGIPSRNPNTKPKLMIIRSSFLPTSWKILLASVGSASMCLMTISFTSSSWSMFSPIPSVTWCTINGSCVWTRSWIVSRTLCGTLAQTAG